MHRPRPGVLLQETFAQQAGGFQDQALLVRQGIRANQLDDLREAVFLR